MALCKNNELFYDVRVPFTFVIHNNSWGIFTVNGFMGLNTRTNLAFLVLFSAVCLLAGVAHAQLTEANITEFVHETTEITSGKSVDLSPEEIQDYLEKHLHKNARFKSTMKYNIPGYPAQEADIKLKKAEFIESIAKGTNSVDSYENEITIENIRISKDKTRATLKTKSFETGSMPIATEGGAEEYVPIEGASSCDQILMFKKKTIQMYSAICVTEINFQPY